MIYRNLDVFIEGDDGSYTARASSDGRGVGVQPLVGDWAAIDASVKAIDEGTLDIEGAVALGTRLHGMLFTGPIAVLYNTCLGGLDDRTGLRLRMRIGVPRLTTVPWEYLYDPVRKRFLAASIQTPVVRFHEVFEAVRPMETETPINLLVAITADSGLDWEVERRNLEAALTPLSQCVRLRFVPKPVTRTRLGQELSTSVRAHVFHFIGHGAFRKDKGYLVLDGERPGNRDPVDDSGLGVLFYDQRAMKLMVLNACEGARASSTEPLAGVAAKLIEQGLPAVVAHQFSIVDSAAIRFSAEFYRSLFGGPEFGLVDAAVSSARRQLQVDFADGSFGAPVLFLRAESGAIFAPKSTTAAAPPRPMTVEEEERNLKLLAVHRRDEELLERQLDLLGRYAPPSVSLDLERVKAAIRDIEARLAGQADSIG